MGLHCSDTFMATAGIIHGNDGPKTDGSGGGGSGVDFVKEGGEERMEEERRRGKDHPRRQFPMRDGCDGIGSSRRAKSRNPGLHSALQTPIPRRSIARERLQRDRCFGTNRGVALINCWAGGASE